MGHSTRVTTKTRLKTVPTVAELKSTDQEAVREAKKKADLAWQMNLALIKLRALKSEDMGARESLSAFHDNARKNLWHVRRAG